MSLSPEKMKKVYYEKDKGRPATVYLFSIFMALIGLAKIISGLPLIPITLFMIFGIITVLIGIFALVIAIMFFLLKKSVLKLIYIFIVIDIIFGIISLSSEVNSLAIIGIVFDLILAFAAQDYIKKKQVGGIPLFK